MIFGILVRQRPSSRSIGRDISRRCLEMVKGLWAHVSSVPLFPEVYLNTACSCGIIQAKFPASRVVARSGQSGRAQECLWNGPLFDKERGANDAGKRSVPQVYSEWTYMAIKNVHSEKHVHSEF